MALTIKPVRSKSEMDMFAKLPWKIYKGNKCWVPPLIKDFKDSLNREKNGALKKIEFDLFLAFLDNEPVGRIFVGIDHVLNQKKNAKMAHFSLFECIENYEVARLLLDTAVNWLKERNIDIVRGPVSPTGTDDDEYKGLLIDCFDKPPVLMNSYNPPYYKDFLERYGFEKDYDLFAYFLDPAVLFAKDPSRAIEFAQKKYNFRVENIDLNNLEREIRDLKHVLDLAVPEEWPDLVPPSLEDVREMAKRLVPLADPDLIAIARSGDEAIGFVIALPDYNQVLARMNGRLTPLAALKFLWYKRKIDFARVFVLFVVPAFRKKGVSYAIMHHIFKKGIKKGYKYGEGSTIGETNRSMRNDIESFGGQRYKTYRIYSMKIGD